MRESINSSSPNHRLETGDAIGMVIVDCKREFEEDLLCPFIATSRCLYPSQKPDSILEMIFARGETGVILVVALEVIDIKRLGERLASFDGREGL